MMLVGCSFYLLKNVHRKFFSPTESILSCKDKLVCTLLVAVIIILGALMVLCCVLFYCHRLKQVFSYINIAFSSKNKFIFCQDCQRKRCEEFPERKPFPFK